MSIISLSNPDQLHQIADSHHSPLLQSGETFSSLGGHFTYEVIGPCCRLFDREELPWPCCRIEWHGKEPSWRRIGRRFVPDLATKQSPSYSVRIVGENSAELIIITLYWVRLSPQMKQWWFSRNQSEQSEGGAIAPPGD
jgi:hypothetical protein